GNIQTIEDLLLTSTQDIAKRCRVSNQEVVKIKDIIFRAVPTPLQRLDTLPSADDETFSTGDDILDGVLGGGIRTGMIWEFVGESSAGKTQLALQLSLFVQLPKDMGGLSGSACYLTTSSKLPTARLLQILQCQENLSASSLENVHTINVPTVASLQYIIATTIPSFIERLSKEGGNPVKVIIIDALGELFHSESKTTTSTLVERSKNISTLSSALRELAHVHRIAVVVLNEVIDRFDRPIEDHGDQNDVLYDSQSRWFNTAAFFGESQKEASLGLVWANQVNTRIMLTRTGRRRHPREQDILKRRRLNRDDGEQPVERPAQDAQSILIRRLSVIFSNVTAPASLDYIVTERGITALPGEKTEGVGCDIFDQTIPHISNMPPTSSSEDPAVSSNRTLQAEMSDDQLWTSTDALDDFDWDALEQTLSQVL
ncbi:P-loop containing nucleoside triphosphate hydrolase protein, partial [Gymnopilus junonius]